MPTTFFIAASRFGSATATALAIAACGGGGSDTPVQTTSATTTFPLAAAMASQINDKRSTPFIVSGTASGSGQTFAVTGNGTESESTVPGVFEGLPALVKSVTVTGTVEGQGNKVPLAGTTTTFFDASYRPLGASTSSSYCVSSAYTPLPVLARIGDNGAYYSSTCYTNSTKSVLVGVNTVSYTVEPATLTTANFKLVIKTTSPAGVTSSGSVSFTVSTTGNLTKGDAPVVVTAPGITLNIVIKYQ